MLKVTLPPNKTPQLVLYARATELPVSSALIGTESRPTLYNFDVSAVPDGDYVADITEPYGRFVLRKKGTDYLIADEFWELDYTSDPAKDPNKILVNHNYGGADNLKYTLAGVPVADASIEVFLFSDYSDGLTNGDSRIAESRQTSDGSWAVPVYLNPDIYILRFYKEGVVGPDVFQLTVSFDPTEIEVIKLTGTAGYLRMAGTY